MRIAGSCSGKERAFPVMCGEDVWGQAEYDNTA